MTQIKVIWGRWKMVFWILLLVWMGLLLFPLFSKPDQITYEVNIALGTVISLLVILIRAISKEF